MRGRRHTEKQRFRGPWIGLLLAALVLCLGWGKRSSRWYTYEGCVLVKNPFNDGDSFHVRTKSRERFFRIYFADAPETDRSVKERVAEQAAYWGISDADVLRFGAKARAFAAEFLKNGFTAYSRLEDARGRSKVDRYYAMIKVGDTYLSEALVAAGLARVYGGHSDLPDGTAERKYWAKLDALERMAKRERKGAWGAPGAHR